MTFFVNLVDKTARFLRVLRWILSALFLVLLGYLGWYGWNHRQVAIWVLFGFVFLLFIVTVGWGGRIIGWILRRLGRKIAGSPGKVTWQVADFARQQTGKLSQLQVKDISKQVERVLPKTNKKMAKPPRGTNTLNSSITWTTAPPPPPPPLPTPKQFFFCYACGNKVSNKAKFCDRCGAQLYKK